MATISIADNDARVQYTQAVTADTTQLTIDFPFFGLDDINVIVTSAAGVDTTLTRGTGTGTFAVVGTSVDDGYSGGYVTLGDSYSDTSTKYTIFRDIAVARTTDFPTSGPFNVSSLNTELDKIFAIEQELETKLNRTMKLADSDTAATLSLPNLDTRKGTVLAFNTTTGLPEAGPEIGDVSTIAAITADISTLADIEDGTDATDAIQTVAGISSNVSTVSGISANVTTVAGISSDVTTVADNDADVSTVAGIDSDVTTVAGVSGNVTTVAGISANVTTVAGISANVTTVAGVSSNVTTVATNISAVNTNATNITDIQNASSNATKAKNWAIKTDGEAVTGEGYSSKAWATGGTGVTDTAGSGAAKEWAVEQSGTVDGTEYSAKEYAIGSQAANTNGSAKQWALGGGASYSSNTTVDGTNYSARYWAEQAASYADSFDDTYLGAKSSDPTVDNDGDPLTAGDLYFNTTNDIMRVYNGTAWNDAVVDTTGFATAGFSIAMSIAL
jgi:hypothetical protein